MPELSRSADRQYLHDVRTASVTTTAPHAPVSGPNVLVIGPVAHTEATVSAIVAVQENPAYFWAPDVPLPAQNDGRTIVIRDIATLSPTLQTTWLAWLMAQETSRPQIVATSSIAIFPLVTAGMFLADLYYRLNTILLDLRASTNHD